MSVSLSAILILVSQTFEKGRVLDEVFVKKVRFYSGVHERGDSDVHCFATEKKRGAIMKHSILFFRKGE